MSDPRFIIVPTSSLVDLAMGLGYLVLLAFHWREQRKVETRLAKVEVLFTALHGILTRITEDKADPTKEEGAG